MINISEITDDLKLVVAAIRGKWERRALNPTSSGVNDGCTWVMMGQVVFVEGDRARFPYRDLVMEWHDSGTGHWGILEAKRQGTRG